MPTLELHVEILIDMCVAPRRGAHICMHVCASRSVCVCVHEWSVHVYVCEHLQKGRERERGSSAQR